ATTDRRPPPTPRRASRLGGRAGYRADRRDRLAQPCHVLVRPLEAVAHGVDRQVRRPERAPALGLERPCVRVAAARLDARLAADALRLPPRLDQPAAH